MGCSGREGSIGMIHIHHSPSSQGSGVIVTERAEIFLEPDIVNSDKKTLFVSRQKESYTYEVIVVVTVHTRPAQGQVGHNPIVKRGGGHRVPVPSLDEQLLAS